MSCDISKSFLADKPYEHVNFLLADLECYPGYRRVPLGYSKLKKKLDKQYFVSHIKLKDEQTKVFSEIKNNTCILNLPTGFGKTILALYLTTFIQGEVLVLVPRGVIYDQWVTSIKHFNIKNVDLNPVISFYNSIKSIVNPITDYEAVIIDEVHMYSDLVFTKILPKLDTTFLFGLTASPIPEDHPYYLHYFKQTISRHLTKQFTVFQVDLSHKPKITYIYREGKKQLDYTNMMKSLVDNDLRMNQIRQFIKTLILPEHKMLILVKNIKTVEFLKHLATPLCSVDIMYGAKSTYNKDANILIGTYQKMGVGFDTFMFTTLVLLDNVKEIIQAEGRLRNEGFTIYDFVDNHIVFKNHWLLRKTWYKKRGAKVDITPITL